MRKTILIVGLMLSLGTWALAQDQDDSAKNDMKKAGHSMKNAAKDTGHAVKKGAVATKNATVGKKDNDRKIDNDQNMGSEPVRRDSDAKPQRDRDTANRNNNNGNVNNNNGNVGRAGEKDGDSARTEALEHSVAIVGSPNVATRANSATINWNTNKTAATDVWLTGGGIRGHRTQYTRGGSKSHSVTFNNLKPNTSYTYEIRTREGGDRQNGTFTTAAH